MDVPRRLRKMNKQPENGSAASFSRHSCARLFIPFLASIGSTAIRMRICGASESSTGLPQHTAQAARSGAVEPFRFHAHASVRSFYFDDAFAAL